MISPWIEEPATLPRTAPAAVVFHRPTLDKAPKLGRACPCAALQWAKHHCLGEAIQEQNTYA